MSEHIIETEMFGDTAFVTIPPKEPKEEIVRCRDCKHGHEVIWPPSWGIPADYLDCNGELVETWDYYSDEAKLNPVKPNGFCAWGDRRDA